MTTTHALRFVRLLLPCAALFAVTACGGGSGPAIPTTPLTLQMTDHNYNGVDDAADIASGTSNDTNTNGVVDEVEIDIDTNGSLDGRINAGVVWQDENRNGVLDGTEIGVAGVTVSAYDTSGALVGSDTTAADGSWRIDDVATFRGVLIQFSGWPATLSPGFAGSENGLAHQFVQTSTSNTSLALQQASPCDDTVTPRLGTGCYVTGSGIGSGDAGFVSFPYGASGEPASTSADYPTNDATIGQVGSVWGAAFEERSRRLFTSAFLKRHAGFGPQGLGGVYMIDYVGTPALSASFTLDGVTPDVGPVISLGSLTRTPDDGNNGATGDFEMPDLSTAGSIDLDAFGKVGAISWGDIDLTEDRSTLWLVNLAQRSLVSLDVSDPQVLTPTDGARVEHYLLDSLSGLPTVPTYVDGGGATVPSGELRPFALAFRNGRGYLGCVATAEYSQRRADMTAYVLSFDPANLTAGVVIEVTIPLNYAREDGFDHRTAGPYSGADSTWRAWAMNWDHTHNTAPNGTAEIPANGALGENFYPQPVVSDIEFGSDGGMVIGMLDRWGHQMGRNNFIPVAGTSNGSYTGDSAGDVLKAALVGAGYVLEGDASTTFDITGVDQAPVIRDSITDGPSGVGEFFYWDSYTDGPLPASYTYIHHEVSIGSLAVRASTDDVVVSVFDPTFSAFSQGFHYYDVTDGSRPNQYRVVDGNGSFGKAAGLGDVELICAPAPAEIGSTVFADNNENGVQDAGDTGIAGIEVTLYYQGAPVACATTDANGNYFFRSDALQACGGGASAHVVSFCNTADYEVRIDLNDAGNQAILNGAQPTTVDAGGDDALDSDGDPSTQAGFVTTAATMPCPGDVDHSYDFGFLPIGCIGDRVWHDVDVAGDQDPTGEPGLVGVTVRLCTPGADEMFGTADDVVRATQTTVADGAYKFTALPPGPYRVKVDETTVPPNYLPTTANNPYDYFLAANEDHRDADFGYALPIGCIGDRIWHDVDGGQDQDAVGEPGLNNVTVNLCQAGTDGVFGTADDVTVATQSTVLDGAYKFTNLAPGTYQVKVDESTLPSASYVPTTNNNPLTYTLGLNEDYSDADFGYADPIACIGDRVWNDVDTQGDQDASGEPGLVGVTVRLCVPGPDGVLGTADDVEYASQATVADGAYKFTNLPPGDYEVKVDETTVPPGFFRTTPAPLRYTIGFTDDIRDADCGYALPIGCIGDRVWNDMDAQQDQDATGEPGLVGVTVRLCVPGPDGIIGTADDVEQASQATVTDGAYKFTGLPPGDYQVKVDESTLPTPAFLATTPNTHTYTLGLNEDYRDADFGYTEPVGCIGDRVWNDADMAGDQNGEPGLVGVTVRLFTPGPDTLFGTADDVEYASQVTVADGAYKFTDLPPGPYQVAVDETTTPPEYVLTTSNNPTTYTLGFNEDVRTVDFGYAQPIGCIGDRVWYDADAAGDQDATGEPGIAGVTVRLFTPGADGIFGNADDVERTSQQTVADGAYKFVNLPAGPYQVRVDETTLPSTGYVITTNNSPYTYTLGLNEDHRDADFGYIESFIIGEQVFTDPNENGVYEPQIGEQPIPGVLLILCDANTQAQLDTTTTDATGRYEFRVPPGAYVVKIDPSNSAPGGPLARYYPTNAPSGSLGATITNADDLTQLFGFNQVEPLSRRHFCGWWVENFDQWPLTEVTAGSQTLSAQQALDILRNGSTLLQSSHSQAAGSLPANLDMSYVLAWALIGAKLNVAGGNNPAVIATQLAAADAWFTAVGGISVGITHTHPRYDEGLTLFRALDAWNRGSE